LDEGLTALLWEGFFVNGDEFDEKMRSDYNSLKTALPDIEAKGLISGISAYSSYEDYHNIQYTRGKLMFYSLRKKMGAERFNEFLKLYYSRYSYKIADREALVQTACEVYGESLSDFFDGWMQNSVLPPL
jgi:hypothetical protein